MFILPEQYEAAFYIPLRQVSLSGGCTTLLLPTTSVDALCATKMLTTLLEADYIQHKVVPIGGWEDLRHAAQDHIAHNAELRSIVLIGCGSHIDLNEYWKEALSTAGSAGVGGGAEVKIFVIDPHRPHNLANLFSRESKVTVLDDGDAEILAGSENSLTLKEGQSSRLRGMKEAFLDIEFEYDNSDDSSTDEDDDDESDQERGGEGSSDVEDQLASGIASRPVQDSVPDSFRLTDGGSLEPPRQRRRLDGISSEADTQPRISRRALRARKRAHKDRVAKYYAAGTWSGLSASSTVFALASTMQRIDNDLLWLAILGLTSQFFRDEITYSRYSTFARSYEDEVARLNVGLSDQDSRFGTPVLDGNDQPYAGGGLGMISKSRKAHDTAIRKSSDLRFLLHKHWSLADSMLHTPYIASKFSLWSDPGRRRLNRLLAKMGFSTRQCSMPYQFMDMDLKRSLRKKLENIGGEYDLDELVWNSFERAYGYRGSLGAGDVVCGIEALLSCAPEVSEKLRKGVSSSAINGGQGSAKVDKENRRPDLDARGRTREEQEESCWDERDGHGDQTDRDRRNWWISNWYRAYDALNNIGPLKLSLQIAMSLHRKLVSQGISIMEKKSIKRLRNFRLLVLRDVASSTASSSAAGDMIATSGNEANLWTNPSMLNKLAMWLFEATKVEAKQILPLVVAVLDDSREVWCVVGVNGSQSVSSHHKSHFAGAFHECADRTGAQIRIDSFDTNVVEIAKDDLESFVEGLVLKM